MQALVVVESLFGNTRAIADAVQAGLAAQPGVDVLDVVDVEDAPAFLDPEIELLVVGAPTHERGLSTEQTRRAAAAHAGRRTSVGVREWLGRLQVPDSARSPRFAVFDTRLRHPWTAGSAAAQASVLLSGKGLHSAVPRESFRVDDVRGPLMPGETDRARAWGRRVAEECLRHCAHVTP